MAQPKLLSTDEITKHRTADDLWIVVDGQVWDMTEFAPEHPGGIGIILQYAGRDASEPYNEIHAPSLLPNTLTNSKLVGTLDTATISGSWAKPPPQQNPKVQLKKEKPALSTLISTYDFEAVAEKTIAPKAWAFYSSAATDLVTHKANQSFFDRIWFRPRVLRKVSTNASYPITDIVTSLPRSTPPHPFFFQLYVSKHRPDSEALLRTVWDLGIRTIFLTVDSPIAGKREADERVRREEDQGTPMMTGGGKKPVNDKRGGGLGRITGSFIDEDLSWGDLGWLRRHWEGSIVIKGIMCAADAVRAAEEGVDGIVLSNHGGRNLDTAPPSILILLDLHLNAPHVFKKLEIYIDGGVRRGTDILKAICLGATAVGLGRPFLYSLNYGSEGVEYLVDLLQDELSVAMALVGITDLSQAHPGLVNIRDLEYLVAEDGMAGDRRSMGRARMAKL
ncbi:MAG: hypothetical protein Q9222_000912 [Ikaeria aurantiellina]